MAALAVGLIGVGAMGLAMAQRLRECGHAVVVRDIDPARVALALAAACEAGASPAEVAQRCSHLVIAVVDGAQTHEVLFGPAGAAAAMKPGSTVLLCPTIAPQDVEAAAQALRERGVHVLDAPMSGGPQRAREGRMSLMVAGDDAAFEEARPLLEILSTQVFRVGTRPGDGARTKLVNNLLAAVNLAGAAEALALAAQLGLDGAATLAVIEASSGQSWIGSERAARHLAGDATVRARAALLAKDSALALAVADGGRLPLPLGRAAAEVFAAALRAGHADADDAVLFRLAQVPVKRVAALQQQPSPLPPPAESAP